MSLIVIQGAVEQGFLYSLVALALFISFRTLDIADLTTDGSFTFGAAASALLTSLGHPWLGLLAAILAGIAAGSVTAFLQTKMKVTPILAGIITMTGLYSINLMVMKNSSTLPLLKSKTVFTAARAFLGDWGALLLAVLFAALVSVTLGFFLRTKLGLSLRATGDNREMVSASSINPAYTTTVGLCLANALTALSGGLVAQYSKFSDINQGTGMVVIGLASLIIGEVLIGRGSVTRCLLGAVLGAVIYRVIIAAALSSRLGANNLKLVSAVIVAIAISYPAIKERIAFARRRKEAHQDAAT